MDYEKLKEVIAKQIKENGRGEITGPVLQAVLMAMVDSLGEVYPQTYTDEQKAQARANIDALSNYDGEITKEKLSAEVQAILNDVANKQNITDESLATIAKTIVGAINEVYKGGVEDASIATSKIEDGAVTEPKLDTALQAKVNNNVKTVEQTLTDDEVKIASKNLKFRDNNGNFFADRASYDSVAQLSVKPSKSMLGVDCLSNNFGSDCNFNTFLNHCYNTILGNHCESNTFKNYCTSNTLGSNCYSNTFGDSCHDNTFKNDCTSNILGSNCYSNTFGDSCTNNILGSNCYSNTFGDCCTNNILGSNCYSNTFGKLLKNSKIDSGVGCVELKSNTSATKQLRNIHILSGVYGKSKKEMLVINIPDEYLNSSRELIITTKRTDGGPSTPEDIVMYYADEVVDKQNKQDNTLATSSKEVVGAINELFNGGVKDKSIELGKLAQAVQDTLGMVGMNVKEVKNGEDLFSLEDGIYALNGTSYKNYPIGIPFYASSVNILVVTHSNQKVTLYGVDGSHSSPILPLVAIGDLSNKIWRGQSFYDYFASNYEVGHKLDQKLDNTSSLSDTEVNNIWDNN